MSAQVDWFSVITLLLIPLAGGAVFGFAADWIRTALKRSSLPATVRPLHVLRLRPDEGFSSKDRQLPAGEIHSVPLSK